MRVRLFVAVFVLVSSLTPSLAQEKKCQADASDASFALWPRGSISTGQTKTGMHPCGKRIKCAGGKQNASGTRTCQWIK
jgi:hypothetical protein